MSFNASQSHRSGSIPSAISGILSLDFTQNNTNEKCRNSVMFSNDTLYASHNRKIKAAELASLFECPVCFDYVLPPIYQCLSGHLVCSVCKPKLNQCPACRGPLGNIRNLAMEKVADSVLFPCKFAHSGCTLSLTYDSKFSHEESCEFRPYLCPCPGAACEWLGSIDQVKPHLLSVHKSITTLQGEDIVFLATEVALQGAADWVMMQSCFGRHFMLVLEKQEKFEGFQLFYAVVLLIGSQIDSELFIYRLELNSPPTNGSRNKRRLSWEASPKSIQDGVSLALAQSDCLVFDSNTAKFFTDNGNLGINVTISYKNQISIKPAYSFC